MERMRRGEVKQITLWETKTRFYLVASNGSHTHYRILKVDRTPPVPVEDEASSDTQASETRGGSKGKGDHQGISELSPPSLKERKQSDRTDNASSIKGQASWNADSQLAAGVASGSGSVSGFLASTGTSASDERYVSADVSDMARLQQATDTALRQTPKVGVSVFSSLTSAPVDNPKEVATAAGAPSAASTIPQTGGSSWSSTASRILQTSNFFNATMSSVPETSEASTSAPSTEKGTQASQQQHQQQQSQPKKRDEPTYTWELNVTSDRVVYTRAQVEELLEVLREGNRASGGLREVGRFFGLVGFIRFTSSYYMVLISRRSVVALIGGHYIYHVEETKILPVCHPTVLAGLGGRTKALEQQEAHLLHTFGQVDLSKNFYFSYTYNLTQTLQENLTGLTDFDSGGDRERGSAFADKTMKRQRATAWGYEEKFVWNYHLLMPAFGDYAQTPAKEHSNGREWVLPLVYGFVDQAKLSILARTVHVTLIARRSRHFAGARFLKRGANESGQVANDVETEQIVCESSTTPFYAPAPRRNGHWQKRDGSPIQHRDDPEDVHNPNKCAEGLSSSYFTSSPSFTSYVMHRGSIPVFWTQDSTNMAPRPPIELSVVDPFFSPAAQHFDAMFARYGTPIILLNLIKTNEKQPREGKLGHAFAECVEYLNQFLPPAKRMKYIAWDMSRASKTHGQDVIGILEDIAEETIETTKFFHSGPEKRSALIGNVGASATTDKLSRRSTLLLQSGVARVNCVDCLDRTNAAQFVIGKAAFGHQLHALGLLDHPSAPFDCDAVNMLTEMYHDLGDTIALQYGGSHLVNTMETYRKINQWSSHSRDMLEGLKRYYSNSFVDADKQMAINLFLGVRSHGMSAIETDESKDQLGLLAGQPRAHYQQWYTPEHLEPRGSLAQRERRLHTVAHVDSGFWEEYYRPRLFTDLRRLHAFSMTAVHQNPHGDVAPYLAPSDSPSFVIASPSSHTGFSHYDARGGGTNNSVIIASPFEVKQANLHDAVVHSTPQLGQLGHQRHRSGSSSMSIKSGGGGSSKAIIGGVRRWMSINRTTGNHSRRGGDDHARSQHSDLAPQQSGSGDSEPAVPPSRAALMSLVEKLTSPRVSEEEEAEYVSYSRQFAYEDRDDTDDGIRVALTSASAGAWASSSEGVAQSDIDMYRAGAELLAGQGSRVEPLLHAIGSGGSTDTEFANTFAGVQQLVSQGMSMLATGKRTARDEAKARAYAAWLGVPVH